jgi:hypothetical protein
LAEIDRAARAAIALDRSSLSQDGAFFQVIHTFSNIFSMPL